MRMTLPLLLVTMTGSLGAQPSEPGARPAFTTAGAFFALSVADVDASARWYTEKLGLTMTMRTPRANGAVAVVLEGGGLIVELVQLDAARALRDVAPNLTDAANVHGFFKAGAIVDDFEGTVARLRERGVTVAYGPFPKRPDHRANVIIKDDAGNLIQLFGR